MRLLRVIPSMDPATGGPCQGIRNSIPALEKIGVYNEVVCLDSPDAEFIGSDPFVIRALGKGNGPWWYHKALVPWLLTNFSRFDVVIVHGLWQYHSYAVWKAMKKYKGSSTTKKLPKVYIMPHGMLDPWFQKAKGRKLKAIRNVIYWKLIEAAVTNDADGVLFTCEQELLLARETFPGYAPKAELNVSYGIVLPPFYRDSMRLAFQLLYSSREGKPYLLFLSRIDFKKGVDLMISSYLALKEEGCELPALVIAGPGKDSAFGIKMQEMAVRDKEIMFPGMLTDDAKWGAFYGCEAFVLSSHQENFGISVVEALACGKPVLISNQVNIWREIEQGAAGIVENDSKEGAKNLLRKWSSLPASERLKMSKNARHVYERNYTIEQAALKMKEVL